VKVALPRFCSIDAPEGFTRISCVVILMVTMPVLLLTQMTSWRSSMPLLPRYLISFSSSLANVSAGVNNNVNKYEYAFLHWFTFSFSWRWRPYPSPVFFENLLLVNMESFNACSWVSTT